MQFRISHALFAICAEGALMLIGAWLDLEWLRDNTVLVLVAMFFLAMIAGLWEQSPIGRYFSREGVQLKITPLVDGWETIGSQLDKHYQRTRSARVVVENVGPSDLINVSVLMGYTCILGNGADGIFNNTSEQPIGDIGPIRRGESKIVHLVAFQSATIIDGTYSASGGRVTLPLRPDSCMPFLGQWPEFAFRFIDGGVDHGCIKIHLDGTEMKFGGRPNHIVIPKGRGSCPPEISIIDEPLLLGHRSIIERMKDNDQSKKRQKDG